MKIIPMASPQLHTLTLKFEYGTLGNRPKKTIVLLMNELRFAHLKVVSLEILEEWNDETDLRPFLDAHPLLEDVSVDMGGKALKSTALPALRRFRGSAVDCITICGGSRPVDSLTVLIKEPLPESDGVAPRGFGRNSKVGTNKSTIYERLAATPTLRRLHFVTHMSHFEDDHHKEDRAFNFKAIAQLAQACPLLTHLEVQIDGHGKASSCLNN